MTRKSSLVLPPPLLVLLLLWSRQLHGFLVSSPHVIARGMSNQQRRPLSMCGKVDESHDDPAVSAAPAARDQREVTWSNRGGKDLVRVADNVWCAERPFVWNSIDVGEPYSLS